MKCYKNVLGLITRLYHLRPASLYSPSTANDDMHAASCEL